MPRRAYRCVINFTLNEVTAPGVWLPSREDVYLSVSLFGQYKTTQLLLSIFPLCVTESFRFEKTYYTAVDREEVEDYLKDELVIFELVQLSEYTDGAVRLASFSSSIGDFLPPFSSHASSDHEVLLSRTIAFNGISPKLSFSSRILIKESLSPELDALEDALEDEKERRIFLKTHRVPTRRRVRSAKNKSASSHNLSVLSYDPYEDDPPPHYRQHTKSSLSHCRSVSVPSSVVDIDLSSTLDPRPTFVVRRVDKELASQRPGGGQCDRNTNATRKDKNSDASKSKSKKEKKDRKSSGHPKSSKSKRKVVRMGGGGSLCSECRAYRKATGRPCIGLGSFHSDPCHAPCQCGCMTFQRQPIHVRLSDDEEDSGIYISRKPPRPASAYMSYRPRIRYTASPMDSSYYPPPEPVRRVPYYDSYVNDLYL